jgi:7-carboxy-7-deazaguanine synthase
LTGKLPISETFASIQGEGIWTGIPSTFIRVSGCNLRCRWCDTPYASWHPEGTVRTIDDLVETAAANDLDHVVVTGGEPMLFDGVEELVHRLSSRGHTITIETAGTVYRDLACDLMSISPKLENSRPDAESGWLERHEAARLDFDVLRKLVGRYSVQLKFVVDPEGGQSFGEIESILAQLPAIEPQRVLLMPEGTDSETVNRRARLLVEPCLKRNWRLTTRLHIDLFGNTKGT